MYHSLRNHYGRTRWNSKVTWVMWNLVLVHSETVSVSVQDRCTVCTKYVVAQNLFWTQPIVLLGDEAQVDASFSSFGDSANLDAR
jgi:hypothetical protein